MRGYVEMAFDGSAIDMEAFKAKISKNWGCGGTVYRWMLYRKLDQTKTLEQVIQQIPLRQTPKIIDLDKVLIQQQREGLLVASQPGIAPLNLNREKMLKKVHASLIGGSFHQVVRAGGS